MSTEPTFAASMELAELREQTRRLANDLAGSLRRIKVSSGQTCIEVEWQQPAATGASPVAAPAAPAESTGTEETAEPEPGGVPVTSPMVGTFYGSPKPGADPFVSVGAMVEPGQTIGLIEAMKLFNPITAECGGVVTEILVRDAEPVEYGQPLMTLVTEPGQP
ncbi:acetyl-CoA carboxylase biotin carboxyl carrier protein [Goodfellowiella coeruleoviolacea]|uniref:Biotin carboxyl carrier protein of acetyl-CoA carboxylase n=1 Tax=Goodfellowiella coeruleoviolacea TaxID=334858 RepID=A0AAE3GHI2_9PSEU|nr:biotin/lipoyl-containing protein [Goodfellowiella coeruleoviolacea]MCP2167484.1 acetyl-CoA carboxylase biotin carboxyl carrier protein [Goodfellowiella coeruleoviolacea]